MTGSLVPHRRAARARGRCWPSHSEALVFECPGQNYTIEETICNTRQLRGFKTCRRCTMRIGGKNDPR